MTETVSPAESDVSSASHQAVSQQTALVLDSDEIRTLTEIGFLAAGNGYVDQAQRIFNALRLIRPDRAFPLIGLAVTFMNARQIPRAVRLLESVILTCPAEQAQRNAWLGFALQQNGHQHASHQLLETVLANASSGNPDADPQLAALARALLDRNSTTMARPSTADIPTPTTRDRS